MYNFLSRPNFCLRRVRIFFSPPKCRKKQALKLLFTIFCSENYFRPSQPQSELEFLQNNRPVARTWGFPRTIDHFSECSNMILWVFSRTTFYVFLFQKVFLPLSTPIQDENSDLIDCNWRFSMQRRLYWVHIGGIFFFSDKPSSKSAKQCYLQCPEPKCQHLIWWKEIVLEVWDWYYPFKVQNLWYATRYNWISLAPTQVAIAIYICSEAAPRLRLVASSWEWIDPVPFPSQK